MAKANLEIHWAVCEREGELCYRAEDRRALIYCSRDDARKAAKDFAGEFSGPLHVEKVEIF